MSTTARARPAALLYWLLVVGLIALGALAIFSIGLPFLVLGLVLAAIHPLLSRPRLFWPPLLAVTAFLAGWWLLGPVTCEVEATFVEAPVEAPRGADPAAVQGPSSGPISCTSLIGIRYAGDPTWIGPVVGVVAAAIVYGATYAGLRRLRPDD